jgi:acetate kinase
MTRAVLTLNAGSSSLKVALFPETGEMPLASGLADRIGPDGVLKLKDARGLALAAAGDPTSHEAAITAVIDSFRAHWPDLDLCAIGHRVVHGGAHHAACKKWHGRLGRDGAVTFSTRRSRARPNPAPDA